METFSQAGQDIWIQTLFRDRNPKECFFLDIGAHDGIKFSNSYALERLGWKGICVEPGVSKKDLKQNRSCDVADYILSDKIGFCSFVENGMLSHVTEGGDRYCITAEKLLSDNASWGEIPKSKVIQYLSLDVEGSEMEVLRGFPFGEYIVEAITVEHNAYAHGEKLKNEIFDFLESKNYTRVKSDVLVDGKYPFEDWYVYKK